MPEILTPSQTTNLDFKLSTGLRFVAERLERSQAVALALRIPVGVKDDPPQKLGLAHLVTETLVKGTRKRNARALSDAFDFYGIKHGESAGVESTTLQLRFLPEHLEPALALLREILSEPSFPAKECEVAKVQAVQELKRLDDEPLSKVFVNLKELYFGSQWGHPELGREELLPHVSREDIMAFWRNGYVAAGAVVAGAGKFDPDKLAKGLERLFANSGQPRAAEAPPAAPERHQVMHVQKESQQTQIALAFPAAPRNHPDYFAAQTAVGVLAGGMSARLFTEVREKRALVYSVGAQTVSLRGTGAVYAYAGTTAPRAAETLTVLKAELKRLGDDATEEEVERAKIGFKAHLLMDQESTGARARELLDDVYYEDRVVPVAEVVQKLNAVSVVDVKAYWKAHPVDPYTLVTLGPQALETE